MVAFIAAWYDNIIIITSCSFHRERLNAAIVATLNLAEVAIKPAEGTISGVVVDDGAFRVHRDC